MDQKLFGVEPDNDGLASVSLAAPGHYLVRNVEDCAATAHF